MSTTRVPRFLALAAVALVLATARTAGAQPEDAPPAAAPDVIAEPSKQEAEERFYKGLGLFRESAWAPALAEFLESRRLHPTRAAARNIGLCLRRLGRYDEALAAFQDMLRDYASMPDEERALVQKEVSQLEALVGSIAIAMHERGATVFVDDRERGTLPLEEPLRVPAGAHTVRIYKDGFLPFEVRLDVAGGREQRVTGALRALGQSGRLDVTERTGAAATVFIDGIAVGRTPWEGALAVGVHDVVLRAGEASGTQPAAVPVRLGEVTKLTLAVESLPASLRVVPSPLGARVFIDGVPVGTGEWQGRLRAGRHRLGVAAEGYAPVERTVDLAVGGRETAAVALVRAGPASPTGRGTRIAVDLELAAALAPTLGGDVLADGCGDGCDRGLVTGGRATLHGTYELASGVGIGVDIGYLLARQSVSGRESRIFEIPNRTPHAATLDDELLLHGLMVGPAASIRVGQDWPLTVRLGAGAFVGSVSDRRTGRSASAELEARRETPRVQHVYVAPELRLGYRLGAHFEVSAGLTALLLIGLGEARWTNAERVVTPEFFAAYDEQRLMARTLVFFSPGLGLRADF